MNSLESRQTHTGPANRHTCHSSFGFLSSFGPAKRDHWSFLAVVLACLITRLAVAAEAVSALPTPSTNSEPHSVTNRYLFIVETSKAMQERSANSLKIVQDLLGTGMNGQLQAGDSIGVWTYDADVHTGRFPVQQYSTNMLRSITLRAMSFLNQHTYENAGKLARAMALMETVARSSEFLTVVLINDGAEPVIGTPFDKAINDSFKLWKKQQDEAKMPFVTVLRAQNGKITHYSVNPAPWPVELPALSADFLAAKAAPPRPPPAPAPKPAPVYAPPIIIRGSKPSTPPAAQPADSATTATATNAVPPSSTAPATNAASATPAPTEIPEPATKPRTAPISNGLAASQPAALTSPDEAKKSAGPPTQTSPPAVANSIAPAPSTPPNPQPSSQPAANQSNSVLTDVKTPAAAAPLGSSTATGPAADSQGAVTAASEAPSLPLLVKLGMAGLAIAAIGSALLLVRRARSTTPPSLITRSMEMDRPKL